MAMHIRAACVCQQLATEHTPVHCVGTGREEEAGGSLGVHSVDPVLSLSQEGRCFRVQS